MTSAPALDVGARSPGRVRLRRHSRPASRTRDLPGAGRGAGLPCGRRRPARLFPAQPAGEGRPDRHGGIATGACPSPAPWPAPARAPARAAAGCRRCGGRAPRRPACHSSSPLARRPAAGAGGSHRGRPRAGPAEPQDARCASTPSRSASLPANVLYGLPSHPGGRVRRGAGGEGTPDLPPVRQQRHQPCAGSGGGWASAGGREPQGARAASTPR